MKKFALPLTFVVFSLLACGGPAVAPTAMASLPATAPIQPNGTFTISVEYAILGVAGTYAQVGISYAKLQDAFAIWGNIEPTPGSYQWGPLDALILEYQQAGFSGLQMNLAALSPWASSVQPSLGNKGDPFPMEEYLDDYAAFVTAVVERYDLDGLDDLPGLLYPIHDYGVEREFTGFWPGSAEEYVRLLRIAYPAIKAADAEANVLLAALLLTDVFDGHPSPAEVQARLLKTPNWMRHSAADIRAILAACDAYDMVDFHSLGDYTEIPLTSAWIRSELQANGCGDRPIWIGDAFPMSPLIGYGGFVPPTPFSPVTIETRDAAVTLLKAVADPADSQHDTAQAWLYAETAIGLTRKIIVSAGEGLRGINVGNMEDWRTGIAGTDRLAVSMLGGSMFMGLTDTTVTNQRPGGNLPFNGQDWARARLAGDPRPGYYALGLVNREIGGFTAVEKLDLETGIWAYRFETPSGPVWALWYDDGQLHLPGDPAPSLSVEIPFEAASARLNRTPTESGQTEPETQTLSASGGLLTFDLGAVPVFLQFMP